MAVDFVEGADVWVDDDGGVVEVEVGALESGEFAPACAGPGGGDEQDSGPGTDQGGGVVGHVERFLGGGPDLSPGFDAGAFAAPPGADGVGGDQFLVGGVDELAMHFLAI